jgi:hypothetical protein
VVYAVAWGPGEPRRDELRVSAETRIGVDTLRAGLSRR